MTKIIDGQEQGIVVLYICKTYESAKELLEKLNNKEI